MMTARVKRIIDEVNELPPSERKLVVRELVGDHEVDDESGPVLDQEALDARWLEEVGKRKADVAAGRARMYTLEEALTEMDLRRRATV